MKVMPTFLLALFGAAACTKADSAGQPSTETAAGQRTGDNRLATPPARAVGDESVPVAAEPESAVYHSGSRTDPWVGEFTLDAATKGLPPGKKLWAAIETPLGTIHCELFPKSAPQTVASFVGLARGERPWRDPFSGLWQEHRPFFDGLAFHRVITTFMIQGGDPRSRQYSDERLGTGDPGYKVPDEVDQALKFDRPGRMAMANSGPGTNSGGSQFFITEEPKAYLNGGYTIFGQCEDRKVVQAIANVPKGRADKPQEPVTMKVVITRK